ncbi:hypothetical protein, partial [Spirillospora sp. NPDC029432]|uniref:hypothetical protein n=1 Tax=Spirillospora sp. NPDC029432 TaxID=3154599 RepID=UPI003451C71E
AAAAGGGGTAGTAAGATGGGIFAAAGTKIAVTVAATALAAGGAGAVVVSTQGGDDGPRAQGPVRLVPVAARVVTANQPAGGSGAAASQQYVTISGHSDPALEKKINAALRAASDKGLATYRSEYAGREDVQEVHSTAQVTLNTKRYLSVAYGFGVTPTPDSFGNWVKNFTSDSAVVIDLSNGRQLGVGDIFTAATLQPAGLSRLAGVLKKGNDCLNPDAAFLSEPLKPFRIRPADLHRPGSAIQVTLRPRALAFKISVEGLDMTMSSQACQITSATLAADQAAPFLNPDVAKELRAATPTPSPSTTP